LKCQANSFKATSRTSEPHKALIYARGRIHHSTTSS
jgi:hypothetical protein